MALILLTILAVLFIIGILIVGFIDSNRFITDEYSFESPLIKEERTFLFLTDLHSKSYGYNNERLLEAIRKIKPDFILVGGDMITAKPGRKTSEIADFIGKLKEISPLCYAMGNHEYRMRLYPEVYGDMYDVYCKQLKEYDISFLDNSHIDIDNFRIYGLTIDRAFYKRFRTIHMEENYIESLLGPADTTKFNILLGHNPDYFNRYAQYGANLSLSGHVHGGIMRLPLLGGVVSPKIRFFPKYDSGKFLYRGNALIVSRGLGVHTIPIRINNPGELSVIKFSPSNKS